MCFDLDKRYWFLLTNTDTGLYSYLMQARTPQDAFKRFGFLAEGKEILQLTFADCERLFGMPTPSGNKASDFAYGNFGFECKDKYYLIWRCPKAR
ncbi:MAG: hypothetical protein MUP81_03650 [Dehalococcoidia bacterium]|nr:hypothetical protein [Dehalococcoidia bacterium]